MHDAVAATQRTFVSGSGLDSNPCTLPAPCRQFSIALAQTLPGGEIVVLDSAGYGPVTINQAVTLVAPSGVYAGISVFSGVGVTINAGAADKVTLRGLTINGLGGTTGIAFNSGNALYLDGMVVSGFAGGAALAAGLGSGTADLFIQDSAFRDNATGLATVTTSGILTLTVERSMFERNGVGASISGNTLGSIHGSTLASGGTGLAAGSAAHTVKVELRDCTISDNTGNGVVAVTSGTTSTALSVVSSLISGNLIGVSAVGSANSIYASDNTITRNTTGINFSASATLVSGSDNRLINNGTDGTFSSTSSKI
jgi:hypothetical protein